MTITLAEYIRQASDADMERRDWAFCAKVLQDAQDKLEESGVRHSWMDAAVSIAKARSLP